MTRPSFFAELQRRNVLRAVVLYAGAVWALAQGVSRLTPAVGLPASAEVKAQVSSDAGHG